MPNETELESRRVALATTLATQDPKTTIEPSRAQPGSGERRAIEALAHMSIPPAPGAGTRLVLEKTIGEGGMGVVRLATQVALGRKVAVKTVKSDQRTEAATFKLLREAWVTGHLEHPNVVPVYDIGLDQENGPVIVLKRIEGVRWLDLIHDDDAVRERFGAARLLDWNLEVLMQVCNAAHFAHSRGIVHRDLKPENVMIGAFGEVYVLDWGIAVSLRDDADGRLPLARDVRELAGTLCYMAPEMLDADGRRLSERTDVYLLGAILYEIVTGAPPHLGESMMQTISRIALSEPRFPEGAPAELVAITKRAMAREPRDRFESADDLRSALSRYLEHRGSAELAHEAERRLEELEAELAGGPGTRASQDRRLAIYERFGQCRFGFQEALRAWPENDDAKAGLRRAILAMVEHELRENDARAAAVLIAELRDAPPELAERVAAAERARLGELERIQKLEELERQRDPSLGQRTRLAFSIFFGSITSILPLLGPRVMSDMVDSHVPDFIVPVALMGLVAGFGYWARESMSKTLINRNVLKGVLVTLALQLVLAFGTTLAGIDAAYHEGFILLLWASSLSAAAVNLDRRFWICAATFAIGSVVALAHVGTRFYVISVCCLVVTITVAWVWRTPLRYSPEERAALVAARRARRRR